MQSLIRSFFGRHLFLTNTGISFGLSGVGDLLEQKIESNQKKKLTINWTRTLHMSTSFGLTSGVLCHFWYNYLDKSLPGRGIKVVLQKIAWDQVIFSPFCIAACLVVSGKMEDKSSSSLASQTIQLGGRLYLAEWIIWPPAQFINFYFLPTRYRVLYDNLVSLLYDTYTSHVKYTVPVIDNFHEEVVRWCPSSDYYRKLIENESD